MTIYNAINLAGGLALFLYGMSIMGTGLEKAAGSKMEGILQKLTSSTWKAVLLGAAVTALIQSSSGTTVIVVGLVNSGILQLTQAIGIIMGANIGTTITGQIIRLSDLAGGGFFMNLMKPEVFAPILAFAGAVFFVFIKSPKKRTVGQILMGFGLLFIGMGMMTQAVSVLRDSPAFAALFSRLQNPIFGVLAGTVVTIAVQSSSASIGILQALSSTGVVTWGSAIPIILGQNIGTTSTSLLAAIGTSKAAKRSAMVHVYFNLIGTALFLIVIYGAKSVFDFPWWNNVMNMGDIANFHTLFNIVVTILFLPFTKFLAWLAEKTVPDRAQPQQEIEVPILDELLFTSPSVAIQQAGSAVGTMARNARANYCESVPLLFDHDTERIDLVHRREDVIDRLESDINNYLVRLADHELSEAESYDVTELLNFVVEFERIGDYAINVVDRSGEIYDKDIHFSEKARRELGIVDSAIREILDITLEAFRSSDVSAAARVEPLEETIDQMIALLREGHIRRLQDGVCSIESGIIFLEILTNLERISDHCSNIATRIIGRESEDIHFNAHVLRREMHAGLVHDYNEMQAQYEKKYYEPLTKTGGQD